MKKVWLSGIVFAIVVIVLLLLARPQGSGLIPVYMTVENLASKHHEATGRWPRSLDDARPYGSPEELLLIEKTFRLKEVGVKFEPRLFDLKVTYVGENFTDVRYVWLEDGHYSSGEKPD